MSALPAEASVRPPAVRLASAAVVVAGSAALLARPLLTGAVANPTPELAVLFVALGLAGLFSPVARAQPVTPVAPAAALAVGLSAFALGRLLGAGGTVFLPWPVAPLLLNGLAAVAEEAFFRRLLYGLLAPRGAAVATVGSAVCFAAVHVTVWGLAVLPLDLAAGLLLGWQRAATGRWAVPAVTHVAANVLAVL